ncbi:MAG: HAD family phosphatase [Weeksellaceae bacterium]|jgi:HAD superfamily hydrolase (TIGR01509 family)|nr:HAD family phosphatase [Weeksellaceae bacterium]MDX9705329.1 HAD family phosphatase [Weeksellaceae bacterium]
MKLKAVLFDMDGVIVDTEPLHRKAYFKMFEEFGMNVSDELYATFAGASTHKVCSTLIEKFNLNSPIESLFEVKRRYFKEYFYHDSEFDLLPGVQDLMKHYCENDIRLILASSASDTTIDMVFEKFNLNPYFSNRISGTSLKASKPHPEIFIRAAELAQTDKQNCMVIEDSTNGITAAHRAEIFCAAYKGKNTHLQDYSLATISVSEFKELEINKLSPYFE